MRRLLEQTPRDGQRLLFSATLDKAIDVLVKKFLNQPVTHEADSVQSPISTMSHHVLHVDRSHRLPVLVDLTSAPGRTVVFTRTKHGAKALARQLNKNGIPSVDLHGNLSQGARTRNMEAFHSGKATTLVATDIAARGIHVDDVALVVHADPPVEHKAYLHRSGRTARAGADGHRDHADDRRAGPRRPRADPGGRHQADHHPDLRAWTTRSSSSSPPVSGRCPVGSSPRPRSRRAPRAPAAAAVATVVAVAPAAAAVRAARAAQGGQSGRSGEKPANRSGGGKPANRSGGGGATVGRSGGGGGGSHSAASFSGRR